MLHNDRPKSLINKTNKRNQEDKFNSHPLDRILTGHYKQRSSPTNLRPIFYRTESSHIIQRQRAIRSFLNNKFDDNEPSIRKPITLNTLPKSLSITSISSPQVLTTQSNESPIHNNNNRQQTIHQLSSVSNRRPKIEQISVLHPMSDVIDHPPSQHSLVVPSNFTFRPSVSRVTLPNRSMKTIHEYPLKQTCFLFPSKSIHQSSTSTSIPRSTEQDSIHTRTLTSALYTKSRLIKQWKKQQQYLSAFDRLNTQERNNDIQDLYITPRVLKNVLGEDSMKNNSKRQIRLLSDDYKESDLISDENESISTDGNSSTSTCHSQLTPSESARSSSSETDLFSSPLCFSDNSSPKTSIKKRSHTRRRMYNHALPPVTEHFDDEETGSFNDMNTELKSHFRQKNEQENIHRLINEDNDENSLTFHILNQQESLFEKQLFKSRRLH